MVALVQRRQKADVGCRVVPCEPVGSPLAAARPPGVHVLGYQPGELLARVAADGHQVGDHRPVVRLAELGIAKPGQGVLDPPLAGILVAGHLKGHSGWVPLRKALS